MMVKFEIPGEAVPKARPRVVNVHGFSRTYTPKRTTNFENLVKVMYTESYPDVVLSGPLAMEIRVFFQIPKSATKKNRTKWLTGRYPVTKRPDLDNLIKSICDALNKVAYDDDSQVAEIHITKEYGEIPKTMVTLKEIERVREE